MHDFDRLAPYYDRALSVLLVPFGGRRRFRASLMRFFMNNAELPANATVADIGCGTGDFIPYLPDSFEIHCYDVSGSMLEKVRKKFESCNNKKIKIFQASVEQIEARDQLYDAVIMSLFLHELTADSIRTALDRAAAILKPKGYLLISDFSSPRGFLSGVLFNFLRLIEPSQAIENILTVLPRELQEVRLEFIASRKFLAGLIEACILRKP